MKRLLILTLILFIFNLTAPMLLSGNRRQAQSVPPAQTTAEPTTADAAQTTSGGSVRDAAADAAHYVGVVAALMPAEYEPEALAAQALAAKTYDAYLEVNGPDAAFPPLPCLSDAQLRALWGDGYDTYYTKLEAAVKKALGYVLEYGGAPFPACSFPLCAGRTENSGTVLGREFGCLVCVPSDGDRLCPGLETVKRFSAGELFSLLRLPADADGTATVAEYSDAGTALRFSVGEKEFTGFEAASALGLDSAAFSVASANGEYVFTVRGKGNFLGMSRYGADFMARQGADLREILLHYYSGAEIKN
ncbi:MAG: SpoIID/LytB domain-containing protein [Clostridia bacterium]|nr:SpoIID/LytB domain-containing protein [Clostridia bacterium]